MKHSILLFYALYNEMAKKLMKEATSKYHYTAHGEDIEKKTKLKSHISI